jgi:hypothetical protein
LAAWLCVKFLCRENKIYITIIAILILTGGITFCFKKLKNNGNLPITMTEEFQYISRKITTYKAINFLNKIGTGNDVIYSLFDDGPVFFYKNKVIGDWFGPARYSDIVPFIYQPEKLREVLFRKFHVKYLLIRKNVLKQTEIDRFRYTPGFEMIYEDDNSLVFFISPPSLTKN